MNIDRLAEQAPIARHALTTGLQIIETRSEYRDSLAGSSYERPMPIRQHVAIYNAFRDILHRRAVVKDSFRQHGHLRVLDGGGVRRNEIDEATALSFNATDRVSLLWYTGRLGTLPHVDATALVVSNDLKKHDVTFTYFAEAKDSEPTLIASTASTPEIADSIANQLDGMVKSEIWRRDQQLPDLNQSPRPERHLTLV